MMSIIQVGNLKKTFTKKKGHLFRRKKELVMALDGISFAIERGRIFSLLGPNGAGKTTTIKKIHGQLPQPRAFKDLDRVYS